MADVCLVLTGKTITENLAYVDRYRDSVDLVELRVDLLDPEERRSAFRFPSKVDVPVIYTIRREIDGGSFRDEDTGRVELLRASVGSGFSYFDFELDFRHPELERAVGRSGARVIRSYHDFDGVPEDLDDVYRRLSSVRGEIPKLAVYPKAFSDTARLARACAAWPPSERIVLGMGSYGFLTRVAAAKNGSFLTFASPSEAVAAPGHVDPDTLTGVYRFREVGPDTRIWSVIGDPVMHSRSPWIHNPAISSLGIDAVYVPIHVDSVEAFVGAMDMLDIDAASVTIPHKERIIEWLDEAEPAVHAVRSCNTVVRTGDGGLVGSNTDIPGFLSAVARVCPRGKLPARAVVVGAGGTAHSVVYALTSRGTEVLVVNRTPEKACALAGRYRCRWGPLTPESTANIRSFSALIVQTTSAGMEPHPEIDPLSWYDFTGEEAVFDVVYAPERTKLLTRAAGAGCVVMNGREMLVEQAYLQFQAFSGVPYPEEAVRPEW